MKLNYLLQEFKLNNYHDLDKLHLFLDVTQNQNIFLDDIIINIYLENEFLLENCLKIIGNYHFGILRRLPIINLYFNMDNIYILENIHNDIYNYIMPILILDQTDESIIDSLKGKMSLFSSENWNINLLMKIHDVSDFVHCQKFYDILKCQFFETELCIMFEFEENETLLEYAYKNIEYVSDSINFLGLRNNKIINCLLKAIREKESGIHQDYDESFKVKIENLMQHNTIQLHDKKSLIRKTMDDFAMV